MASRPWTLGQWAVLSLIPISLALGIYLGLSSERTRSMAWRAADVLFPALFALQMGLAASNCFSRGVRLGGWCLGLASLLLACWSVGVWFGFAQDLGLGQPLVQAVNTLLPVSLTLFAAYGARNAFHRHSRLLGAALSLLTVFIALWAIGEGLDLVKPWR